MKTTVNLLPQSFRRQQMLRKRMTQWASIIALMLLTGWAWHWNEMREYRHISQQLETLSREHAPTQKMLKQIIQMRQQLVELQQQEDVVKELDGQRNALTLLGVVSDTARKTKGRLRVAKLELDNFQGSDVGDANATKPPELILNGESLDNPAVAELLDGLQKSGIFSRVELLTLKQRGEKAASLRDYVVRCEF
ncbi:MAG TPA: PilN domain-containing protein [Lacipirellulaceae bacterium]|nr:PilN domain-containing protein [Lacipirellulaceae bacterium]